MVVLPYLERCAGVGGLDMKKYRPANGTEGMIFQHNFCDKCVFRKENAEIDCIIDLMAMNFDIDDGKYPKEWVYDKDGEPTCTKFKETK